MSSARPTTSLSSAFFVPAVTFMSPIRCANRSRKAYTEGARCLRPISRPAMTFWPIFIVTREGEWMPSAPEMTSPIFPPIARRRVQCHRGVIEDALAEPGHRLLADFAHPVGDDVERLQQRRDDDRCSCGDGAEVSRDPLAQPLDEGEALADQPGTRPGEGADHVRDQVDDLPGDAARGDADGVCDAVDEITGLLRHPRGDDPDVLAEVAEEGAEVLRHAREPRGEAVLERAEHEADEEPRSRPKPYPRSRPAPS
jgi:hypothetical protein